VLQDWNETEEVVDTALTAEAGLIQGANKKQEACMPQLLR
jgi:hypothetical protein